MSIYCKHDLNASFVPHCETVQPQLLIKQPGLTVLYLNLPPGQGMAVHDHPGCHVTLHGMVGAATVCFAGESQLVRAGEIISFSGDQEVEPRNDSSEPAAVLISLVTATPASQAQ